VQGPARTLWLSGIHAPVPVKPDTKMLSGLDGERRLRPDRRTVSRRSETPETRVAYMQGPFGEQGMRTSTS